MPEEGLGRKGILLASIAILAVFMLLAASWTFPARAEEPGANNTGGEPSPVKFPEPEPEGGTPLFCVRGGTFCVGEDDISLGDIINGIGVAISQSLNVVNAAVMNWDSVPAENTPTGVSLRVLQNYGVTPGQFVMACGKGAYSSVDGVIISLGQGAGSIFSFLGWSNALGVELLGSSASGSESIVNLANGWLILLVLFLFIVIILFFGFAELQANEEIFTSSSAGNFTKEIAMSLFGREHYNLILGTPSRGELLQSKLKWGNKIVDYLAPVDRGMMGRGAENMVSAGSDLYGKDEETGRTKASGTLAHMARDSIYSVISDVLSVFSAVKFMVMYGVIMIVFFLAVNLFDFTVNRIAFILSAVLPRPAVVWILMPFDGGPIPVLNVVFATVFKFLGIFYIVGLVKPGAIFSSLDIGIGILAGIVLYILLVLTAIGLQIGLFWIVSPVALIKQLGKDIMGSATPKIDNIVPQLVKQATVLNQQLTVQAGNQEKAPAVSSARAGDTSKAFDKQAGAFDVKAMSKDQISSELNKMSVGQTKTFNRGNAKMNVTRTSDTRFSLQGVGEAIGSATANWLSSWGSRK